MFFFLADANSSLSYSASNDQIAMEPGRPVDNVTTFESIRADDHQLETVVRPYPPHPCPMISFQNARMPNAVRDLVKEQKDDQVTPSRAACLARPDDHHTARPGPRAAIRRASMVDPGRLTSAQPSSSRLYIHTTKRWNEMESRPTIQPIPRTHDNYCLSGPAPAWSY